MAPPGGWENILHSTTEPDRNQGFDRLGGLDGIPLRDLSAPPFVRRVSSAHLKINMDIRSDVEVGRNDEDKAIPPVVNRDCEIEAAKSKKKSIKAVMNMEFACDKH
ncbi:hypothetical protein ABVK25_006334 [Lepraria finkii]|uniref:Uncharacterized protein n=1 Tax=Lepraria finkii TaxID=1340010 RepID=A0ABR4B6U9_9LECA